MRILFSKILLYGLFGLVCLYAFDQEASQKPARKKKTTAQSVVPAEKVQDQSKVATAATPSGQDQKNKSPVAGAEQKQAGESIEVQPEKAPEQKEAAEKSVSAPAIAKETPKEALGPVPGEETEGINTINLAEPRGNWLIKRIVYQRAEAYYEKIKTLAQTVMEHRMDFFQKRSEWDKNIFDPFYLSVGLERGVLETMLADYIAKLQEERTEKGSAAPSELDFLTQLETEKNTLEQLQKDVEQINEIDRKVDEAITVLIQQINLTRTYENRSWQNFKGIAQELSEKKAYELLYGMSAYWQSINDISAYLQGPFLQYFEQLGSSAKDQIAKVEATLTALKEKGIDFKKQWQTFESKSRAEKDKSIEQETLEREQKKLEQEKKQGFFGRFLGSVTSGVGSVWNWLSSGVQWIWNFTIGRFFSKKSGQQLETQMQLATPPPVPVPVSPVPEPVTAQSNVTPGAGIPTQGGVSQMTMPQTPMGAQQSMTIPVPPAPAKLVPEQSSNSTNTVPATGTPAQAGASQMTAPVTPANTQQSAPTSAK